MINFATDRKFATFTLRNAPAAGSRAASLPCQRVNARVFLRCCTAGV